MTDTQRATTPGLIPPQMSAAAAGGAASVGAAAGTTEPEQLTDSQLHAMISGTAATTGGAPTLAPPGADRAAVAGAAADAATATWRTNVQISALFSVDEVRNAWAYVAGIGWKKLYNGRDGAFSALAALAAQARQTGRNVTLREEADGMIYEIYLW